MEPSLPADVLLLAVGDRGKFRTTGDAGTVLAGALLCSEAMAGAWLPESSSTKGRRKDVERLIKDRSTTALEEVSRPLCLAGVLAPLEHRVLGIFPRRGFVVLDAEARRKGEQRLLAALAPGGRPDAGTAALAVLCALSGIARDLAPPPRPRAERKALAAHLNGLSAVVGPEVAAVLLATRAVYRRSGGGGGESSSRSTATAATGTATAAGTAAAGTAAVVVVAIDARPLHRWQTPDVPRPGGVLGSGKAPGDPVDARRPRRGGPVRQLATKVGATPAAAVDDRP